MWSPALCVYWKLCLKGLIEKANAERLGTTLKYKTSCIIFSSDIYSYKITIS